MALLWLVLAALPSHGTPGDAAVDGMHAALAGDPLVLHPHPGEAFGGHLRRCLDAADSGGDSTLHHSVVVCQLPPGTTVHLAPHQPLVRRRPSAAHRALPLIIRGHGADRTTLSGIQTVDATFARVGSGRDPPIFVATLPADVTPQTGTVEQVFGSIRGEWQWLPEARWPNVRLPPGAKANEPGGPLDHTTWASSQRGTALLNGSIFDPSLAATNIDWTGALATLNVGYRFRTWTRVVTKSARGSPYIQYDPECQATGWVGGTGIYMKKQADNKYFLSGVLAALDSPGEFFYEAKRRLLYVWMPDDSAPVRNVSVGVRVKDYCIALDASGGPPVHLANMSMLGCTFSLTGCKRCVVSAVNNTYPTYQRTIPMMGITAGDPPALSRLEGDDSVVERYVMRYSNNGALKVVGSRNVIRESLFEDLTWLGTRDFPPIELGFGSTQPTASSRGIDLSALGSPVPPGDHTVGNDNVVTRTTVRRFGEMGILTSQRSNEVSYTHVHHGGLIGLDHAAVHADNTFVSCMNWTLPLAERANCSKRWHHNWVHDAREKCVRGDDYTLNLTVDHSVVFNCGFDPTEFNLHASTGCILKGDYNAFYQNTVFNVSHQPGTYATQGDLCVPVKPLSPAPVSGRYTTKQQNAHTVALNSAVENITTQSAVRPNASLYKAFAGLWRRESAMRLVDPSGFDSRPQQSSPLRGAGVVYPPYTSGKSGGANPDIGAYQYGEPAWTAGCTFHSSCVDG